MQAQTLRVLLAEDCITETGITLRALCADQGRGLELVFVSNVSNLSDTLLQSQPHIAFLALSLLQPDPPRAVSLLKKSAPHIPLILFVQPADKAYAVRCLHAGAENYMLEGFLDVPTLDHVLHSAILCKAASAASPKHKPRLHTITNLPGRSGLLHQLQQSSRESVLSGPRLLVSVCLTNLKQLQSAAGLSAAAQLLRQTAQHLQSLIRRSDLIAYVAPGVFELVIFEAGDSCLSSLQRRIQCRLLTINQPDLGALSPDFSVQAFSWTNASPFSFPEILASHLPHKKQSILPPLALAGNSLAASVVRSGQ